MDEKTIPPQFDEAFLRWFRARTEAMWQQYPTRTFEEFVASGIGGRDWQQGTRWLDGLSEQEIAAIEQQYQLHFPPDHRLFLRMLHSVDRAQVRASYVDDRNMIPSTSPSFYNWQMERDAIAEAYQEVIDGMLFDVHNGVWFAGWGRQPATAERREARIRKLFAAAPRLVPIIGHRFLLADPCQSGNPVLSIHQTDIIIYAPNLYCYLLKDFTSLLHLPDEIQQAVTWKSSQLTNAQYSSYEKIPFWGTFL